MEPIALAEHPVPQQQECRSQQDEIVPVKVGIDQHGCEQKHGIAQRQRAARAPASERDGNRERGGDDVRREGHVARKPEQVEERPPRVHMVAETTPYRPPHFEA